MKFRIPIALLAAVAAALLPAAQAQTLTPEALYRLLGPSVFLVRAYDTDDLASGTGSAVVIAPETLLTNCHVVRGAKRFVVRKDNVQYDARLQHADTARDLCQIHARNLHAPAVELGDSDQVVVGQKVYALGNPQRLELTLSDGLVSALRRDADRRNLVLIQTSAPISQGSSGGGLFDAAGRLIGITTLIQREGQNLNFAIPINWQRDLAARSAAQPAASSSIAAASPPQLTDVDAVPVHAKCKEEYRKFLAYPQPRAFAVADRGRCAWQGGRPSHPHLSSSPDPSVRAMELCVHWHGAGCTLYAVDSAIVFKR
ncbi:serine protease [Caenimonas sedimenti]|uniref:Serine protease n=1 Tax=Caenimonas sedimenti TaxID=2596921 RepID=A0A562ZR73_9BURK|nr:S1C family serine protease [Caenimonas sedimenti]TWO71043.1 serine protease [Caenimonas sedimenti]